MKDHIVGICRERLFLSNDAGYVDGYVIVPVKSYDGTQSLHGVAVHFQCYMSTGLRRGATLQPESPFFLSACFI